jgi:hypothetical protein
MSGDDSMPAYRIYWLNQDDHITEADWLIVDVDDEVREVAASYLGKASAVEIWHHARRIVRVSANKTLTTGRV